jgi:hypothetical protein
MDKTRSTLLRLLAVLCAGASFVAGCASTPAYSNRPTGVRCDDTGTTEERHACR